MMRLLIIGWGERENSKKRKESNVMLDFKPCQALSLIPAQIIFGWHLCPVQTLVQSTKV